MSTRTNIAPIAITCPTWCNRSAEEHVAELWEYDGDCIHYTEDVNVADPSGWSTYGKTVFHEDVTIWISVPTAPDGRETASPILYLNERELSLDQALALADALRDQVAMYRGGDQG